MSDTRSPSQVPTPWEDGSSGAATGGSTGGQDRQPAPWPASEHAQPSETSQSAGTPPTSGTPQSYGEPQSYGTPPAFGASQKPWPEPPGPPPAAWGAPRYGQADQNGGNDDRNGWNGESDEDAGEITAWGYPAYRDPQPYSRPETSAPYPGTGTSFQGTAFQGTGAPFPGAPGSPNHPGAPGGPNHPSAPSPDPRVADAPGHAARVTRQPYSDAPPVSSYSDAPPAAPFPQSSPYLQADPGAPSHHSFPGSAPAWPAAPEAQPAAPATRPLPQEVPPSSERPFSYWEAPAWDAPVQEPAPLPGAPREYLPSPPREQGPGHRLEPASAPQPALSPQAAPAPQPVPAPQPALGPEPGRSRWGHFPEPEQEREPRPEEEPAAPRAKKKREPYLDNVKFVLIALVVTGHSLVPTLAAHSAKSAYMFIYTFHMPAFVLLSGYLGRNFWNSNAKINKLVDTMLVPYAFVEIGYALLRYSLGQKWTLTIIDPAWLNWYLVALVLWRISTPIWTRMRQPLLVAVTIYMMAGFSEISGDFSLDRFFGLLPFYVLGLLLKPEHFDLLKPLWVRITAGVVFVAAIATAVYIAPRVGLDPVYYRYSFKSMDLSWWMGLIVRAGMLLAGLTLSFALFALVPRRETWFSELGTRTLYAYLLHGVVVLIAKDQGWLKFPWLYGPLGVLAIASCSFLLATILCLPQTRTLFKWLLEPRLVWLYRRPTEAPANRESSAVVSQ
ncbi:acyltransferase family protein [Streptosporangium sp. NPDC051022]|uniref:acyltransferase family protein n=1 Tax=Streptosporangium sp. NPDC051022 TaxID=3155752 RepID=UPI003431AB95